MLVKVRLLLFSFLCYCLPNVALAHDSNLATFQIRHLDDDQWIYEVMTPLYGLDKSLSEWHSQNSAKMSKLEVGSTAYKEQVVAYIKDGFRVFATAKSSERGLIKLALGAGRIKLDDHLTVLIFEIIGMPETVHKLEFNIANMTENEQQHNIFRLIDGENNQRYILTPENNFSGVDVGFFN